MILLQLLNSRKSTHKHIQRKKYHANERHRKNFSFRRYLNVAICTCEPHSQKETKPNNNKKKLNTVSERKKIIIETRQNRQFSMRLTFVVIYSFIFKRFFLFVRFDATGNLLLLFIVIVFPFFFAPFVFGWYSNLIKSHSTASLVLSCINPRILPISWQSQLGRWCIFQKLFFFALHSTWTRTYVSNFLNCFVFIFCV